MVDGVGAHLRGLVEWATDDSDLGAYAEIIVEIDDIIRCHTDASIACRVSDAVFLRGAVDVYIAGEGVAVVGLFAI